MKGCVSLLVLASFLRLQLVCCCGAVGHCDTVNACHSNVSSKQLQSLNSNRHEMHGHPCHRCVAKTGSHPGSPSTSHSSQVKVASETISGWKSSGSKSLQNSESVGHSADGSGHHHLYWLVHGNGVPKTKVDLRHVLVQTFAAEKTLLNAKDSGQAYEQHLVSLLGASDLLILLGHWRI